MTKKHFIALADAIIWHNKHKGTPFTPEQLGTLASFCKSENGRFDYPRWLGYINGENGPNGGQIKP